MILNCKQAQELVNADIAHGPSQSLLDFVNDLGGRVSHGRLWLQVDEPSPEVTFTVLKTIHLYFAEQRKEKVYCRENCGHDRAMELIQLDAGIGTLTIRAQLYDINKRDPSMVAASHDA